jgi:hypothetical protein
LHETAHPTPRQARVLLIIAVERVNKVAKIPDVKANDVVKRYERKEYKSRDATKPFAHARKKRNNIADRAHDDQHQRVRGEYLGKHIVKVRHNADLHCLNCVRNNLTTEVVDPASRKYLHSYSRVLK